jgi:hypothetical protein
MNTTNKLIKNNILQLFLEWSISGKNIFLPRNKRKIILKKNRKKANKYSAKFQLLIWAMGISGIY